MVSESPVKLRLLSIRRRRGRVALRNFAPERRLYQFKLFDAELAGLIEAYSWTKYSTQGAVNERNRIGREKAGREKVIDGRMPTRAEFLL